MEDEFLTFCQQTLADVEKRIKRAKQRLSFHQMDQRDESASFLPLNDDVQEKVNAISKQIEELLESVEEMGCEGRVDDAQETMKQVERLKSERTLLKKDSHSGHWIQQRAEMGVAQEKQMQVCDVCGAFLVVNDIQQRVDDHLMGKQHVGFKKLKTAVDEILKRRKEDNEKREVRHSNRRDRSRSRERRDRHRNKKRDHQESRKSDRRQR